MLILPLLAATQPPVIEYGPVVLILAATFASATSGYALRRALLQTLVLPPEQRTASVLLVPYLGLLVAAIVGIASLPMVLSVPGSLTFPFAIAVGTGIGVSIWLQFMSKVLTLPSPRLRR